MIATKRILATLALAGGLALALGVARAGTNNGPKVGDTPPEINCTSWLNSQPLTLKGLRGRVVLLEFWSPG